MKNPEIIEQISQSLNLPKKKVEKILDSYFKTIRKSVSHMKKSKKAKISIRYVGNIVPVDFTRGKLRANVES